MSLVASVRRPLAMSAVGLLVPWVLVSCSGDAAPADKAAEPAERLSVVQPGLPGEQASPVDPDDVPEEAGWNHDDAAFMQMMVLHHAQALDMARLAPSRAGNDRVAGLAERIEAAQGPEIMMMAAWLDERSLGVPRAGDDPESFDHSEHGHAGMAGMLTDEQMKELEDSAGRSFDRLFLEGMIAHHEGALAMAERVLAEGEDLRVNELAADVSVSQAAEISRMRELLRSA